MKSIKTNPNSARENCKQIVLHIIDNTWVYLIIFFLEKNRHEVHYRVSAGFYYTKVKWPHSYKFLRPFVLKGTYSIGQLCPNLPKTYRSFNDILRCGLIHLMQLELNLIFICFKLAYLLWYLELTTKQVFRGHHLFPKKS